MPTSRPKGIPDHRVKLVGNVMVDTLFRLRPTARERRMSAELGVEGREFAFVTLHRPSNVDDREVLAELLGGLSEVAAVMPVIFPIHPRTRQRIADFKLDPCSEAFGFSIPSAISRPFHFWIRPRSC